MSLTVFSKETYIAQVNKHECHVLGKLAGATSGSAVILHLYLIYMIVRGSFKNRGVLKAVMATPTCPLNQNPWLYLIQICHHLVEELLLYPLAPFVGDVTGWTTKKTQDIMLVSKQ